MKYIIAGGRDFNNRAIMFPILSKQISNMSDTIISGDARGADELGAEWATHFQIPIQHFPAQWDKYGKSAGFIRNAEMGEEADALIAFWDGKSKGTAHMIKTMKIQKKPYWVYDYNGNLIEEGTQTIDKDKNINYATIKIYNKENNNTLMEFETPINSDLEHHSYNSKKEIQMRIPGSMIQNIQLGDGTNFIEQYGNYDKYEFEIPLKE